MMWQKHDVGGECHRRRVKAINKKKMVLGETKGITICGE